MPESVVRFGIRSAIARVGRRPLPAFVAAALLAAAAVIADPYPPYWTNGTGASIHYAPAAWPADGAYIAYTRIGTNIADKRDTDGSNGGTSPQGYVNVSSGCTDQAEPSVYYAYDGGSQVMFFRWRVQAPPHNYATGPNAGSYASTSPWSSALWTVFMDTNGDGYRDFAVHLDGSSGSPSGAIDRIASIWSSSRSQSLDYPNDPAIHLLRHNPAAFVDGPSGTDRILNFHNSLTPDASWPNGSTETTWDYGTTRATLLNTGCGEYFIDYQIPLAMLNATSVGGPQVTPNTPMSLFFATANSLQNPIQKDAVVAGDFVADPTRPIPGGDTITPSGGTIHQPTVTSLTATGCGATTLTANVFDTLNLDRTSTVSNVVFYYYADGNGDGVANDSGSAWTVAAAGTAAADPVGKWTASWNSSGLTQGRYLLAARATDASGNVTWSQFASQAAVDAFTGGVANNFPNAIGAIAGTMVNSCGAAGPSISKTVSPSFVAAGGTATFTIAVANTLGSAITVSSITDLLPAGFAYASTIGTAIGVPTASPAAGATGSIQWTFAPVTVPASTTRTLVFTATASNTAGTYTNSVSAATSSGTLSSGATEIGVGSPSLTIAKSASVASANPGDAVAYTIGYANDSAVNVTNAVITDVLPVGLDFVSASGGGVYVAGTRTVTWTIGSIASGSGSSSVTVNTMVTTPYPGGATIPLINTASIASTETSAASASVPLFVNAARAVLAMQKLGSVSQVTAGGNVTYTLSYSNTGAGSAGSVTITDPVPAGWAFVSATGGGVHSAGTVTWNLGTVAAGASGSVQVVLQANASYAGANPSTNTATITGTGLSAASGSVSTGVIQTGSVCNDYYFRNTTVSVGFAGTQRLANTTAVTASDTGTAVSATWNTGNGPIELARFYQDPAVSSQVNFTGATVTSSIWIDRANGAGVDVTGQLFDYDPASGATVAIGSTTTTFNGSVKGEFAFSVTPSNTLTAGHRLLWVYSFINSQNNNSVTLVAQFGGTSANTISGGTSIALARSRICTTAPANPAIDNRVDKLVAAPGDTLIYAVPFGNAGGTNMTSTQIVDTLPDGVSFVSATLNGVAATPASTVGQQRTFNVRSSDTATIGQVTAGQTGTLVINATVPSPFTGASDTLTAVASLTSAQTSQLSDNAVTTLQRPLVTIAKSANRTLLVPGDTVTYTLTVLNSGPGTASNVTVGDVLPATAYFTYVANSAQLNGATISPDPVGANVLSRNIGSLAAGSSAAVTFNMAVSAAGAPAGTTPIANTATVSDAGTAGSRSSNASSVTISTNPNLALTKASSPAAGPVAAGSAITYTLTLSNTGSGDATGVIVRDVVPSSTTYSTGTLVYAGSAQTDASGDDTAHFDAAGNRAVFVVGTLAAGASRTLSYTAMVNSPLASGTTTIGSTATATATNAATKQATASITASAAPVLTLVKGAPASVAYPLTTLSAAAAAATSITVGNAAAIAIGDVISVGGTAATVVGVSATTVTLDTAVSAASGAQVLPTWEYRLSYANTGTSSATSVVITDVLPAGLTFISADSGGVNSAGTVSWNLGTVASGASGTVRVRVRPGSAATYANTATLASAELSTVTSNSTSTTTGGLTVNKSTTTPSGSASGSVTSATYVITLQNQNPSAAATGVIVKDDLAAGFTYAGTVSIVGATASASPAVGDPSPTWSGVSIPANSTATITFTATVSNVAPGTFQNYVTVTSANANVLGFDALATTSEDVAIAAALGTTGAVGITSSIAPGATLTVTVTDPDLNGNPAAAETVQVTVINTRTNESETVTLTETGVSTGIFSGTLATNGSLLAGTNNAAPLNVFGGDTVRASYNDTLTSTGGAAAVTADGAVVATNLAPVVIMTVSALAFTEGNSATAIDTGLIVTDADSTNLASATVSITGNFVTGEDVLGFADQNGITGSFNATTGVMTLTGSATVANYQAALRSVTYANSSTNPSTANRTISVIANDGTTNSNTATRTVTVAAVNNAPVVTMTVAALAFTEGNSATAIDAGLTVTDADSTNLASATVSITGNFVTGEDVLGFADQNGITGSFSATTGVMTLTGSASVANYQVALRSVTYANSSTNPSTAVRTVSVVANDGTANSNTATRSVTVAAVNNAPVVTMTSAPLAYAAAAGPVAVDLALTAADVDSTNLAGGTMAIAGNFKPAEDSLAFTAQSGITGTFNATTGVLTLSGSATVAQYQAALRSVTYTNNAAAPDTSARTVTLVVTDGTASSNTASRGIAVAAASAPTLDQPGPVTVDEDSGAASVTLTGIGAGVSGGALTVVAQAADPTLFGAFTVVYANPAADASLQFTPAADAFGATDVVITVTAGAPGSVRTTSRTFRVTIAPVNDRPTLDALQNRTADVGVSQSLVLAGIGTGAPNEVQPLTVTAVSSNPAIVPAPLVSYGAPAATGTLSVTAAAAGSAVITVTVDDGQALNATVSRTFTVTAPARVNTPPTITPIADMSVTEGAALPAALFTVGDAETPASGLTVTVRSVNATLIPPAGLAVTGGGAARTLALVNAANRIGSGQMVVTVSDGELSASASFTATVRPQWDYYLPDGWAQGGISTVVRATNPHADAAPVRLTFLKPAGDPRHQMFEIPALTRWSAGLSAVPAAGAGEVSTFIRSVNNLPLLVERTMTWDADGHAGSAERALDSTNMQWFFAEGAQGALRTNLILANPNDAPVTVTVTFVLESGAPVSRVYDVAALARRTLAFHDIPALAGRSFGMIVDATLPIAAERTTYLDVPRERQGGHTSAGVPYPSTQWYFAEGSNWKIFQSYMLLLNPGSIAANVRIEYHTMTGAHYATTHVVGARTRLTVDTLAAEPRLDGQHFWMSVTSDQPIVAERSMYWDRGEGSLSEGHNSHGVIEPARRWSTGDARVGGPQQFSTFVLVGNPSTAAANLTITVKRDAGADIVSTLRLAPLGRDTINVNTAVPGLSNESFWLLIDSDVPIVVERSQYWGPQGSRGSWSGGTNTFAVPVVPADYNGCVYNVGPAQATVPAQGGRVTINVGATSRCTFTAEPGTPWLRVEAGASGSGVSAVVVRVAPNATPLGRTGTVMVAGQAVSITQDAAPAAGVGQPLMALDRPIDGARVGSVFRVSGWAVDLAAMDQTPGVQTVHVWAYPDPGSDKPAIFLGIADYGHDRVDVEHAYGERTRKSGFALTVRGLDAGRYGIVAFAYSTVMHSFSQARAATVTVAFDARIVIDTPRAGPVTMPAVVAGWVTDLNSEGETGIDAVHVWAYPAGGGPAVFAGVASYGHSRPDVAAAFGHPASANSGYAVTVRTLEPGPYQLVVFAKRTGARAFDVVQSIAIDVADSPRRFLVVDTPTELEVVGPSFTIAGWAADIAAATGSGVDTVHIWAHPAAGGSAIFLGAASYGNARPDVARYLGAQFEHSGFWLSVTNLPVGTYRIAASAHSSVTRAFDQERNRVVTVTPSGR